MSGVNKARCLQKRGKSMALPRFILMKWSPSPISRSSDSISASLLMIAWLMASAASKIKAVFIQVFLALIQLKYCNAQV